MLCECFETYQVNNDKKTAKLDRYSIFTIRLGIPEQFSSCPAIGCAPALLSLDRAIREVQELKKGLAKSLLITASVLGMTACASGSDLKILEQDPQPEQPTAHSSQIPEIIDPGSLRFAVEYQGANYFIGTSTDKNMGCVLAYPTTGNNWLSGCGALGGNNVIVNTSNGSGTQVILVGDGADPRTLIDDGWTQIHQNIYLHR